MTLSAAYILLMPFLCFALLGAGLEHSLGLLEDQGRSGEDLREGGVGTSGSGAETRNIQHIISMQPQFTLGGLFVEPSSKLLH